MNKKGIISLTLIGVFCFGFVAMAGYVEPTGEVKGKVKKYDKSGYTHEKVEKAKVRLYKKNGKKVDSDKSNSKGKYKFEDVKVGDDYYIKCSANGYVNAKDTDKVSYKSGKFDVKADKTVEKSCRLMIVEGEGDIDYSARPKGTSKREWRLIMQGK